MRYGAATHAGLVRDNNEDAYLTVPPCGLFVVCDGVGGMEAGEVASRLAVEAFRTGFPLEQAGDLAAIAEHVLEQCLVAAVETANRRIREASEAQGAECATTLTAALVRGRRITLVHAGDSVALLIDEGGGRQLTHDHTVAGDYWRIGVLTRAEAETHPDRNKITRAVGVRGLVDPDVFSLTGPAGSTLLLCTDGLTDMVDPEEIARLVNRTTDPQEAADQLVAAALRRGGRDNVTVIVVKVETAPVASAD